ncbi:ATP-grasp peptide maturase system methyltransferase [Actinoplanes sp. CA-054009]
MTARWSSDIHRFVKDLEADGYLNDPAWRQAFTDVPRHLFLPEFFKPLPDGRWQGVDDTDPDYARLVYSDSTLTTQLDEQVRPDPAAGPVAGVGTSSSTQPSLMAYMLDALQVTGDERVLEIGTGTGYNAALLSHRLGGLNVTSVEVDTIVAEFARRALAEAGYTPTVVTADGQQGWTSGAPYDRLIATVSVPTIPPAWIRQIRDGGFIVTSLWRDLGGGPLARLTVNDGTAQGFFLPTSGGFMPVRSVTATTHRLAAAVKQTGQTTATTVPSSVLLEADAGLWLALRVLAVTWLGFTPVGGAEQMWLFASDGSWAAVTDSAGSVEQYGPRRLWDEIEVAYAAWDSAGRPRRDQLGLTVSANGAHRIWLDSPETLGDGNAWNV